MAQYYRVLSQDDKGTEEATPFYQNIDENQTVQYVIASDGTQQQFQAQPVVVTSDQLMVVEGQGQQVIIDQSQVAYQPSSYVIQDTSGIDFPNNRQQQVYYMTNTQPNQQVVVEQPLTQQPVVLNHQVMQNPLSKVNVTSTAHQNCPTDAINTPVIQEKSLTTMQQIRSQLKNHAVRQSTMNPRLMQMSPQKVVTQTMPKEALHNNFPRNNGNEKEGHSNEEEEEVPTSDTRMMSYGQFRKIMIQQKQALQERVASSTVGSLTQRKPRSAPSKLRNTKPKPPVRMNRNANFIPNTSMEEQHYEEHKTIPIKQNLQQQFQNTIQQRQQQVTRPPPPQVSSVQESQSQYLIQPRPRDNRPQIQRPLPQFLHSSQIQNIIDSAPKSEEYTDSIRMLVLLDNGEQRLITFTLPKEACTIQEILEQVGVPFTKETPIQVSEANANGLNYIVAVGNIPGFSLESSPQEEQLSHDNEFPQQQVAQIEQESVPAEASKLLPEPPSPEPRPETPPRLVDGQLAVCNYCGYLSEHFNRCLRCRRTLPDNVKSVPAISTNGKKVDPRSAIGEKKLTLQKANGVPRMNLLPKKPRAKPKLLECETVVVSSDEEDDSDKKPPVKNVSEHLLEKLGASVTISPISKEPSIVDIQKTSIAATLKGAEKVPSEQLSSTLVLCRTVRIGSYRFVPPEPIRIDSNGVSLKVPHPKSDNTIKIIKIDSSDIVKVLISFQKSLPVLFYYLLPSVGGIMRSALDMSQGSEYYFDPLSETEESHRRITLLPETLSDDCKHTLQKIYSKNGKLDELTYKEANDILIKTCPKELSKSVLSYSSVSEIKPILVYPPEGRGRLTINTEDYMCLGQDQFLNDVIIDFYLKYLVSNLPKETQDKVHVFSTFFYKRLTTKPLKASRKSQPAEIDPNLTPAQKRHTRVKTWTKNVNVFDKDFIIIPINENCHWFLAIICFPNMNGCQTMDGQSIKIEPRQSKKKKAAAAAKLKEKKVEQTIMCEDPELSDKDEAEGDDSELESDDSEESSPTISVENNSKRPPIKQPCILIFDSLAGASRSRVVATLRDYLTCEYKAKLNVEKNFTKEIIKGACPKVPQQTNFTDCGLYLLQYVEQFFNDPIKDYYIPINHLKNWFEEITVTRKREDISLLIQSLMKEAGTDLDILPEVTFPTLNGELTERALLEKEDKFIDPDDEMMEDEDEEYLPPSNTKKSDSSSDNSDVPGEKSDSPVIKPSSESVKNKNEFTEQTVVTTLLKPDISELPRQSNRDTLSYLKAKRIIRHKNNTNSDGGPDAKKVKSTDGPSGT